MSRSILILVSLLSVIALSGCPVFMTRNEVDELENKKQTQDQVVVAQKGVPAAEANSRFSDIDSDLREMNGRIEVLENRLGQANSEKDRYKKLNEEQTAGSERKIQLLQEEVTRLEAMVSQLSAEMAAMKSAVPEKSGGTAGGKKDLFQLAEEQFEQKNWKKAALTYQKFKETNPKSKKVPEAIYKMGVCFQELEMKDEAKSFYEEVIANYSSAPEAKKARTRLKSLKK